MFTTLLKYTLSADEELATKKTDLGAMQTEMQAVRASKESSECILVLQYTLCEDEPVKNTTKQFQSLWEDSMKQTTKILAGLISMHQITVMQ